MQNTTLRRTLTLALTFAASSCTELTTIGWSGEPTAPGAQVAEPRHVSAVSALPGELLQPHLPSLGDIDGDGLDDFILMATPLLDEPANRTAYLFYGRSSFAEQVDSRDADATFVSGMPFGYPLGDINGDGLADFALGAQDGYEFIFGSRQRLSGSHKQFEVGSVWRYHVTRADNGLASSSFTQVVKLGDVNGDGYDDVLMGVSEPTPNPSSTAILATGYVVMGRKDSWPSGEWDRSWSTAQFAPETLADSTVYAQLIVTSSGDLDGDGYSDLIAQTYPKHVLYYGKPEGFQGQVSRSHADAQLDFGYLGNPVFVGDLDGDGKDDLSNTAINELQFFYGSSERYAGAVRPTADLSFYDQGPYSDAVVGDFNSDGHGDVIFIGNAETRHWDNLPTEPIQTRMYELPGKSERLSGRVQLSSSDAYRPIGYPAPSALESAGFNLSVGGDFDGDGSSDLIVGTPYLETPTDGAVLLLPGATRAPD